ncbi:MAG: type I methionyl aminopeptidase [Candidatus Poribacteria bacterium]|nr:type I methionyl aminopeptidase [Candidatus Poribacteria bacterium]
MNKVRIKSRSEIETMRRSGKAASIVLQTIGEAVSPGISTYELDQISREAIKKLGGISSFLGYQLPHHPPYPATICVSINEEIVHGIPRKDCILKEGDIIGIDTAVYLNGFHGDNAYTFPVGDIEPEAQSLLEVSKNALYKAIDAAKPGSRLGDACSALQTHVESHGFSVVRDFVGHGIGRNLHEEPQVPNYGEPGRGVRLRPGTVLAIEAMTNAGTHESETLEDGWTAVTADRRISALFEHTVAILPEGPEILTDNHDLWGSNSH